MKKKEKRSKDKSLAKQIKEINRSLTPLSSVLKDELGVVSVQVNDGVFYCGKGIYKKIYMFKPSSLGNKRAAFIKSLTDRFDNRIRFTICFKNYGENTSSYMFMTVYFDADSYYDMKAALLSFETRLLKEICVFLKITIVPCSVDKVLSFINLMFSGEMRSYPSDYLFKKEILSFFPPVNDINNGFFSSGKIKGVSFVGKNIFRPLDDVTGFSLVKKGTYFFVIDFRSFNSDDEHVYSFDLRTKYSNHYFENDFSDLVNMSYFFSYLNDSDDDVKDLYDKSFKWFDSKGIYLMPGVGCEKEMFYSNCSFGLSEFHMFQTASANVVGSLLF